MPGEAPPALYGLAPDQVIHIGSFSRHSHRRCARLSRRPWHALGQILAFKSDGGTGALDQMVAAEYFRDHFDSHVARLTRMLKRKLDVLVEAIDREFGTVANVQVPLGGLYAWVRFPKSVDARKLSEQAAKAGIAVNAAGLGGRA